jgi:hypothetical protein
VLLFGGNAFGIRARQGHRYASVFEATQAYGTARIAGLKVLVRSACLLTALVAVVAGVWTSASVIPFDVLDDNDTLLERTAWMRVIQAGIESMRAHELLALAFVAFIAVAVMVAVRASFAAQCAHPPRRLNTVSSTLLGPRRFETVYAALLAYGVIVLLLLMARRGSELQMLAGTLSAQRWIEFQMAVDALLRAMNWAFVAALLLVTLYLLWTSLAERLLTTRSAAAALLVWAAFAMAWVTVVRAVGVQDVLRELAGVQLAGMPATDVLWMLLPMLLPPFAGTLALWSLSRARHI